MSIYLWCVIVFVTVLFCLTLMPLTILVAPLDRNRSAIHWVGWLWSHIVLSANPLWTLKIEGKENIAPNQAYLVVSNHQSMGDICGLFCIGFPFKWISKKSAFFIPLLGWAMWVGGYIPLIRGNKASIIGCVRKAKHWLHRGMSVAMFPEGTRSPSGKIRPFKDGAFRMSVETGVPILPITIDGTMGIIPKGSWVFGLRAKLTLVIGKPKFPPTTDTTKISTAAAVTQIREETRSWIIEELARLRKVSETDVIDQPISAQPSQETGTS